MYEISHIRSVSVGLESQIWYLFIYITGYLNVRKISETMDFRTFVGPLFFLKGYSKQPCLNLYDGKCLQKSSDLHKTLLISAVVLLHCRSVFTAIFVLGYVKSDINLYLFKLVIISSGMIVLHITIAGLPPSI